MIKLVDVKSLRFNEATSVLINNPVIKVYRDKHDYVITFCGDRVNVDFVLDYDNEATPEIISKIESSVFEGLNLTIGVHCGSLYAFVGHMSTEDLMVAIERS